VTSGASVFFRWPWWPHSAAGRADSRVPLKWLTFAVGIAPRQPPRRRRRQGQCRRLSGRPAGGFVLFAVSGRFWRDAWVARGSESPPGCWRATAWRSSRGM
jgi:hypothetical protein